jgi:hypothetical protein
MKDVVVNDARISKIYGVMFCINNERIDEFRKYAKQNSPNSKYYDIAVQYNGKTKTYSLNSFMSKLGFK